MTSKNDETALPSRNRELLSSLVGQRIASLVHLAEDAPSALLASHPYTARSVRPSQLFALADGPALLTTERGDQVVLGGASLLWSVTVERARLAELGADWPHPIGASDATYSEPKNAKVIGRSITAIRVLQHDPPASSQRTATGVRSVSPKVRDLPREVAVIMELGDGVELRFVTIVVDAPNDFAILTDADAVDLSGCRELFHVGARQPLCS